MHTERRFRVVSAFVVGVVIGLVGCDSGEQPEGWMFIAPGSGDLSGLWTGEASIDGSTDRGAGPGGERGKVRFPISIDMHRDQGFTLRTVGYPVSGSNDETRTCEGVYRVSSRHLEFFPNGACRALPLYRYTIGRYAPDGLTLRAEQRGSSYGMRVDIDVERNLRRGRW